MSTSRFVGILAVCGIGGAVIGMMLGFVIGNVFPDAYANVIRHGGDPAGVGMAYGLGQGLVVGLLIGAFFIYWKTRLTCAELGKKTPVFGQGREVAHAQGKFNPFRGVVAVLAAIVVFFVAIIVFLYLSSQEIRLRARPKEEGLALSYYGSKPIMIVGFNDRTGRSQAYRLQKPILLMRKDFGKVVPWKALEPVNANVSTANPNVARHWEVVYVECRSCSNL